MVRRAIRLAAALVAMLALSHNVSAQASSHERVGVDSRDIAQLSTGASLDLSSTTQNGAQAIELDPAASLDIMYRNAYSFSASMPLYSWLAIDRDSAQRYAYASGDPFVALGYTRHVSDWRLGASLSYSHPLGVWNAYQAAEIGIASSSGYPTLGLALTATRYLDPVIASLTLKAQTGLARSERFGWSSRPLVATLAGSLTEALNANAALSLGADGVFYAPTLVNGSPSSTGSSFSMSGNASFILSFGDDSMRASVSKPLVDYSASASLSLSYNHAFRIKEKSK